MNTRNASILFVTATAAIFALALLLITGLQTVSTSAHTSSQISKLNTVAIATDRNSWTTNYDTLRANTAYSWMDWSVDGCSLPPGADQVSGDNVPHCRLTHRNTVEISNGKCKKGINYPFCFGELGSPEIEYTHEDDGHHLLDYGWELMDCIGPHNSLGECWSNDTSLGWLTIPIEAEGSRRMPISFQDAQQYAWFPCLCPVKTTYSPVYEVD